MTSALPDNLNIRMPAWLIDMLQTCDDCYPTLKSRMALSIQLAKNNIEHASGGPFAAAVFDMDNHQFIAAGVNLVVATHCSMAHAEMIAISMAQQRLACFDLSLSEPQQTGRKSRRLELVTSCEPCAMCFGAIPWSGIKHVACGARDADARAIGFDEGPKMDNWRQALTQRGIAVSTDICRQDAVAVLQYYALQGGEIYNAGTTS
ncbi:MAG: nucleoside deaminase [Mariprofundus sp.]|nr:nucleoside deaminase [Mariprofundus sp.]